MEKKRQVTMDDDLVVVVVFVGGRRLPTTSGYTFDQSWRYFGPQRVPLVLVADPRGGQDLQWQFRLPPPPNITGALIVLHRPRKHGLRGRSDLQTGANSSISPTVGIIAAGSVNRPHGAAGRTPGMMFPAGNPQTM